MTKINVIDLSETLHGSFFDHKLYLWSEHDRDDDRRNAELDDPDPFKDYTDGGDFDEEYPED